MGRIPGSYRPTGAVPVGPSLTIVDPSATVDDRWSADVVLSDGSTVHVRPIEPGDGDAIRAFHERQSRESIYFRYFSPRPKLSDDEIDQLTTVDGVDRMAFIAERDDDLLGVARYDRYAGRQVAEVAFFTDDQYNGRGIATLLLEYLAAHAREAGIQGFEAHVLPSNRRMVRVFKQAGFQASSEFADGVIEVTLGIDPTEEAAAAMAERAHRAERQAVVRLLEPRSVAVIGAGRSPGGIGHRLLRNLLSWPFQGAVYPVHPEASAVAGVQAHASPLEIPDEVDLAVVCVPAADVPAVVEDCGRARVRAVIVISAGFAEAGADGRALEEQVVATARRYGMRILGPNCLGVINTAPDVLLHAMFTEIRPLPGRVGLLSQSGTLGAVILERARAKRLGISSVVAVGNKSDLAGNDVLQYWLDDERTDVVLLYLESFGNPRRFGRNVRQVARTKPVFAVRSGAVLAHDERGQGSGLDDDTIDALLRETGVVRVPTITELLDAGLIAVNQPIPLGSRVAIVGNSGGSASMAADACAQAGLELATLSESTLDRIGSLRLDGRRATNPIDLRYDAEPEHYTEVLDAVLSDNGVDIVLVAHAPYEADDPQKVYALLDAGAVNHPDTTIVACIFGPHQSLTPGGVPIFDFPDEAALAIGAVARYRRWLDLECCGEVFALDHPDHVSSMVREARGRARRATLAAGDARAVLTAAGLPPVSVVALSSVDDVESVVVEGPVAVKAERHAPGAKTRETGVALDVGDADELASAVAAIDASLGEEAWPMLVQPMVAAGTDVRVAVETHPLVGPVVRVGPGGSAGRFADAPRRVLPVTDLVVGQIVDDSGVADLLSDAARANLEEVVRRLAAVVDAAPEIVEVVCDPVIVRDDDADIVELRMIAEAVDADPGPAVRRLDATD